MKELTRKQLAESKYNELFHRQEELNKEIDVVLKELKVVKNLEKPYVANVSAYSGHSSMQFKTEEKARGKLREYAGKQYFRNGLNYGVYLYKWEEDGTKTLLEVISLGRKDFTPPMYEGMIL